MINLDDIPDADQGSWKRAARLGLIRGDDHPNWTLSRTGVA